MLGIVVCIGSMGFGRKYFWAPFALTLGATCLDEGYRLAITTVEPMAWEEGSFARALLFYSLWAYVFFLGGKGVRVAINRSPWADQAETSAFRLAVDQIQRSERPAMANGMFRSVSEDGRNALKVAAAGGATAGLAVGYTMFWSRYQASVAYWIFENWGDALFYALGGALIASAIVYVLIVIRGA